MSIAEYQVSLKNLIDATNDETVLKRWKAQLTFHSKTSVPLAQARD